MTELKKTGLGIWFDSGTEEATMKAMEACFRLNQTSPLEMDRQREILEGLLGRLGEGSMILPPFECHCGDNIEIGERCFLNHYVCLLDFAPIRIGSNVRIGPFTGLYALRLLDSSGKGREIQPITVGDSVWLGGNVTVMGGVTVGEGSVIGAKSLVESDVPPGVIAAGNPCRVIREITEKDRLDEGILSEYARKADPASKWV